MSTPRLEIVDTSGRRTTVPLAGRVTTIGRRTKSHVHLDSTDVSRDHADVTDEDGRFILRDRGSRFGTFVNGAPITERLLVHGDTIRVGQGADSQMTFLTEAVGSTDSNLRAGELHQVSSLLWSIRKLGSGRVLDDVLAMVVDSAIDVSGAERGFIMLARAGHPLEFKMGRGRGGIMLPGRTFETSRKIPEEVFETGEVRAIEDLRESALAEAHRGTAEYGIRYVLCVPLDLVQYVEQAEADHEQKRIGVLYLDSRERGAILLPVTRAALEKLAIEAALAIENARLYRESMEKARLEQELRFAAEIQQSLMPAGEYTAGFFDVAGTMVPCRAVGGDFFDYGELAAGGLGFALGDVSGKGAAAALLTAVVQGMFTVESNDASGPAEVLARINISLKRRNIESKFVTMFFGVLVRDGRLTYSNGGHNPPVLMHEGGTRRLDTGGMILGVFDFAHYEQETVALKPGDTLVIFSDGISEAQNPQGEEYGDSRIIACLEANRGAPLRAMREALVASVHAFSDGVHQGDDMTLLFIRYVG